MESILEQIPVAWIPALTKIGVAILIVLLGAVAHGMARRAISEIRVRRALSPSVESTIRLATKWTFAALTALLVLHQFGVLANVWAALAAVLAMVAVGFVAVWSIASNISATVLILLSKPFAVGDEVVLLPEEVGGKVIDLNVLFTTLRADDGSLVQAPNNIFFQRVVRRRPAESPVVGLGEQLEKTEPTE